MVAWLGLHGICDPLVSFVKGNRLQRKIGGGLVEDKSFDKQDSLRVSGVREEWFQLPPPCLSQRPMDLYVVQSTHRQCPEIIMPQAVSQRAGRETRRIEFSSLAVS